jgi:hypothetical protein
LLNAGQCNSRRFRRTKDSEVADRDLQFACCRNRLYEQSGGTPNAMMSILTLSSPKEMAARDGCISPRTQQINPASHVANLHQPLKNIG